MDDIRNFRANQADDTPTKFSVYRSGSWSFASLTSINFTKITNDLEYSRLEYRFGIVYSREIDPRNVFMEGGVGDYLLRDSDGNLSIVKKDDFAKKY